MSNQRSGIRLLPLMAKFLSRANNVKVIPFMSIRFNQTGLKQAAHRISVSNVKKVMFLVMDLFNFSRYVLELNTNSIYR